VSAMRMVAPSFLFGLASAGMAFVEPRARRLMIAPSPVHVTARGASARSLVGRAAPTRRAAHSISPLT
jgi:hypothetical protein